MRLSKLLFAVVTLGILGVAVLLGRDDRQPRDGSPGEQMAEAATKLLVGLRPELRARAEFAFDDPARLQWHYYPTTPWPRKGAVLVDMTATEKELVKNLLRSGTSEPGYRTALDVMALEGILRDIENTDWARKYRNPDLYYVLVFGKPGPKGKWGWRVEGHHLVVSYVIEDGVITGATPTMYGANPAEVPSGPHKGKRILAREEDLARRLYTALGEKQGKTATISEKAPFDILTEVKTQPRRLPNEGLPVADMNERQRKLLRELIELYAGKQPGPVRDQLVKEIDAAGIEKVRFAWAGPAEPGEALYYRVQGPTFVIEYCNAQNRGNHAHSIWRSYTSDFGIRP